MNTLPALPGLNAGRFGFLWGGGAAQHLQPEMGAGGAWLKGRPSFSRVSSETTPRHVRDYAASRLERHRGLILVFSSSLYNSLDSHCLIAALFSLNQSQFSKLIHRPCSYLSG
jgi:hypothetical protein